tara:strand:- start:8191 stop:8757 length:567 start_codon:yes stop_codon:yes gene_type:complete
MQSPYSFIVKPLNGRRYDNIRNYGDKELIISVSEEDHTVSNRFAEVINVPVNYKGEVSIGDTILVHHNVFKYYNDMYGRQKSGRSWVKDDLFIVDFDQFFLYKKNNKWNAFDKYCFVKPIAKKDSYIIGSGVKNEPLHGELIYLNKQLEKLGLKKGDKICYEPFSEYEFVIEGELLYRMYTNNITIKL